MRRVAAFLLVLAGCLRPDLVPCGDLVCPAEDECRSGACVSKESIEKCEGQDLAEGASCVADDGRAGRCIEGACAQATCGDGYVDAEVREECDGSTAAQCVDFGFDLGRATCTECAVDTAPCVRFGWRRIVSASSQKLWTDGTIVAYTMAAPAGLRITGAGYDIDSTEFFYDVDGGGGRVFALDALSHLVEADGTTMRALPMTGYVNSFDVADDGTPYIVVGCTVSRLEAGAWVEVGGAQPAPGGYCTHVRVGGAGASTRVIVKTSMSAELYRLSGNQFVPSSITVSGFLNDMQIHGTDLWLAMKEGVNRVSLTTTSSEKATLGDAASFAFIGPTTYIAYGDGTLGRYKAGHLDRMRGPTGGRVTDDGHGGLYMYRGPIYRFSGIGFGELASPPLDINDRIVGSVRTDTAVVAQSEQNIYVARAGGDGWDAFGNPSAPAPMTSVSGNSIGTLVVAASYADAHSQVLMSTGQLDQFTLLDKAQEVKLGVWMAPDDTVFAVGFDTPAPNAHLARAWFGRLAPGVTDPGAWTVRIGTEQGCRAVAVSGTDAQHVVAAGRCEQRGVVWALQPDMSWAELYRSPAPDGGFVAVARTADGKIFASGDTGTAWFDGTWHTDANAKGRTLSGSSTDMWLSGALTTIQHFDGTSWSQVSTSAISDIAVVVGKEDVLFPGGSPGHVALIRDPDVVP